MRNLSFNWCKWDKKYLIAALITFICAFICGVVLCIFVNINFYFKNFADDYIFFVFSFNNGSLIFSHFLTELIFLYLFFLIAYFTRFKYITLILLFIRSLFFALYTSILFGLSSFGGITVAIFVFVPTTLISIVACCLVAETCKIINKRYVYFIPLILAVAITLLMLVFVNVVFRVVIIIV